MLRDYKIYLDDVLESIRRIEIYTSGLNREEFEKNILVRDGVIHNLMIIGEAVKHIPAPLKKEHPQIEWKKIAGLRDILIHGYFSINFTILWDIIITKIPELKVLLKEIA